MAAEAIQVRSTLGTLSANVRRGLKGVGVFARRYPLAAFGGTIAILMILVGVAGPLVLPLKDFRKPDIPNARTEPGREHFFGTDLLGRDVLGRVIHGSRNSYKVAFAAVTLGVAGAILWGVASGYIGGMFDLLSQRFLEVFQAFPSVLLALVAATAFGRGLWTVVIVMTINFVAWNTRVMRAQAIGVRGMTYVEAARAIGASPLRIMAFHVVPQVWAPAIIIFSASLGTAIYLEAVFGFIGVGVPPPTPTWGQIMGDVNQLLRPPWWVVFFPGLSITLIVLGFNLLGDGIRDTLDPRLRGATAA